MIMFWVEVIGGALCGMAAALIIARILEIWVFKL